MNLVGNSCIASYITRDFLKQPFVNPFCWCIMDFDSCYNLVKYWDSLDFSNYTIVKDEKWNFSVVVDSRVVIKFVHYIFDPSCKQIVVKDNDVYSCKIWEYINAKYIKRIANIRKEPPVFLFASANYGGLRHTPFTLDEQRMLERLDTPYKIILSFKEVIHSDKLIVVEQNERFTYNGKPISAYIYDRVKSLLGA